MTKFFTKITHWEAWPFKLLYAPISLCWVWYIIKSGAVWFFTPSNPKLTFGGMEGEPKREMYDLLPKEYYPTTFNVLPNHAIEDIEQQLITNKINYPFIVKPEVGGQGVLFRKIDTIADLIFYHSKMPVEYIVQQMVHHPMEVSVFYIRHPKNERGEITGFLHKIPLQIIGDGMHTVKELVLQHPKAFKKIEELQTKHKHTWETILPTGEKYMLSYAANHNRGAQFIDLKNYIDDDLVKFFDTLSHSINDFFYGRYDIMCDSVEDLKKGKNFSILEYNGCGAEPNHFYDTGYTLLGAYKEILKHWKALYLISKHNAAQGHKPWPVLRGAKFLTQARKEFAKMKIIDEAMG
jgi:hypothetical protein